ncbi:MAG: UDP-4-amino-4,6-dideoxy-N-acetyl-beta-L-altrosamine N-acetyltransferase [Halobacillus sp.]|uniref:UDP-4-amino-4, 6-dideoxy-N-acetyl-beta-L-altrosamine N-acetyltransferase n=1 Tax=Halobacillus sp. TaxID=56800 RepID=UPI003BB16D36
MNDFQLRRMEKADLPLVWQWRNAEHIRTHMYNNQIIPWEEHLAWFEREQSNPSSASKIFIHQGRPLGVVRFTGIDQENETCKWGFYIGDKDAPKGSGTIMGILALDFIFETFPIRKVCAEVLDTNQVSLRYHEKLGFKQEGRLLQQLKREKLLIDVIPMGLFRYEWINQRKILAGRL